jgi:hypothetical protein
MEKELLFLGGRELPLGYRIQSLRTCKRPLWRPILLHVSWSMRKAHLVAEKFGTRCGCTTANLQKAI